MAVAKKKRECVHSMMATDRKGIMEVESMSLNKRGMPTTVRVNTTIFSCVKCGYTEEYPDFWEKNFILPKCGKALKKAPKTTAKKRNTA